MKIILSFTVVLSSVLTFASQVNHIVTTRYTADPAPVVDGDKLYVFMGNEEIVNGRHNMWGWSVASSTDAKTWVDAGTVMSVKDTFPWARSNRAWASQAIKREVEVVTIDESKNRKIEKCTKWYWYVAVFPKDKGWNAAIAVAVADKPEGPWRDALGKPLVEGWAYIDPSVFVDVDGQAWLFWGNCGGDPGLWYAPLKENMVELAGEVREVPGLMDEAAFGKPLKKNAGAGSKKEISTNFEEAPWIYRLGDTYYLEYAAGGVPEHWAYSTAKSMHGPWTYRGKILGESDNASTSHGGSVFFKGEWYMVNHDGTLPGGGNDLRSVYIRPYKRNADGSIPFLGNDRISSDEASESGSDISLDK